MASTVWRGQLTFGLVVVPVRLYRAARKQRIRLNYLRTKSSTDYPASAEDPTTHQADDESNVPDEWTAPESVTRISQTFRSAVDETPVPREQVVKGYEVAPQQFVTFKDEELRQIRQPTSPDMQILRTVHLSEIDPVYFETSYYVAPEAAGERAYSLLNTALRETQYVALARFAMHGRERIVAIRPGQKGLLAHSLYYNDEIRAESEVEPADNAIVPKELTLAKTFVQAISGPFAPEEFKDTYREHLQQLIARKSEARQITAAAPVAGPATAPVIDIMEALTRSLKQAKQSATQRRPPARVTKEKAQRRKA